MRKIAFAACAVALLFGCHKASSQSDDDDSPDGGGGTFVNADGGVATLAVCDEDTKDVYVVTGDSELYQFHPPTLEFTHRGLLTCPTSGASPTSMAIDRTGIAWILYSDSSVWRVNTHDLSCGATNFAPPAEGFLKFGMGFASDEIGSQNEQLFLSDHDGAGLGIVDTDSLGFRFIGPYSGALAGITSELTGTGDGKLYGFFVTSPATIAEISKGTGDIVSSQSLDGVNAGAAWAFSFYGGDFYIYTDQAGSSNGPPLADTGSNVTRYRPSDGSIQVLKTALGFRIVGAGVSTCAPTSLPH